MIESFGLMLAAVLGGALGVFFFGGLWWTVQRGLASPAPALWFFGSLLLRTGLTALGFVLISRGQWDRTLACLAGFFLARVVVTRLTHKPIQGTNLKGANHAP